MTNDAEALVCASKRAPGTFIIFISQPGRGGNDIRGLTESSTQLDTLIEKAGVKGKVQRCADGRTMQAGSPGSVSAPSRNLMAALFVISFFSPSNV